VGTRRLSLIVLDLMIILILAVCILPSLSSPSATPLAIVPTLTINAPGNRNCTNEYYPVSSGATWTYSSTGGSGGSYSYVSTMIGVTETGFTVSNGVDVGVTTNARWSCKHGNLTALEGGSIASVMTGTGEAIIDSVYSEGYLIPATIVEGQTWTELLIVNSTNYSGATVEGTGRSATSWECTGGGTESVTVPAGSYLAVTITCSISVVAEATVFGVTYPVPDTSWDTTIWLAKHIGVVQTVSSGDSGNETVVLTAHQGP